MSLLSTLRPKKGSKFKERRVGRGDGSGWGGTAAKGHKGQKARSGAPIPRGFEGGQTPLFQRMPKFGFKNTMFKTTFDVVNLDQIEKLGQSEISPESLRKNRLVGKRALVKILGRGELKSSVQVRAHKVSQTAKAAIEKAGGSVELIPFEKPKWKREKGSKTSN